MKERFYRVRVQGSAFVMRMEDGEVKVLGFHATRWVTAESEVDAGRKAAEMIRTDRRMEGQLEVRLVADSIDEVPDLTAENNRSGFMFYDSHAQPN